MVCLFIATSIWLLIKLSKDYNYSTVLKVSYTNAPPGKAMSRKADSVFILTLRASGFHILYSKILQSQPVLNIDISQIKLKKSGSYYEGGLQTTDLSLLIQAQLDGAEKLTDIYPRNINFRFENVYNRRVAVKPDIELNFRKQYGLYGHLLVVPDSVLISGPSEEIRKIKSVSTQPCKLNDVFSYINTTLPLMIKDNRANIHFEQAVVRVMGLVAQFTEASITVPVSCDSLPAAYTINTYPPKVRIFYRVAMPDYEKIKPSQFRAGIDYRKAMQQAGHKLKVNVYKYPEGVEIIRTEPDRVEFLLSK
jgi:hypothetical protein